MPCKSRHVLRGTLDPSNPLSMLRGNALVWDNVLTKVDGWYERHIDRTSVAFRQGMSRHGVPLEFPPPRGICVNMMPIKAFDRTSVPEELAQYRHMISVCPIPRMDVLRYERDGTYVDMSDRVVYLTIHESLVPVGECQRRPGLHVERPGAVDPASGGTIIEESHPAHWPLAWGLGMWHLGAGLPLDGIYVATNVAGSCRVYPALIDDPHEVSDELGGIEHMRSHVGPGEMVSPNELCWITDRTPHESMPVLASPASPAETHVYRQFFRLVVGRISVWHSKHNTANPTGLQPDAPTSDLDKFHASQ